MVNKCAKGSLQSPIDIKTNTATNCGALCDLLFYYRTSSIYLENVNGTIIFTYDNGSYIVFNNEVYELEKISFFTPSAHKIDGANYPLELNIYHRSPNTGRMAIISILYEINEGSSGSHACLEVFASRFPQKSGERSTVTTSDDWNIFEALPEIKSFYTYKGSLPREPCTENVEWIVLENSANCSAKFHNSLQKILNNNARPTQALNNRKIYYNNNTAKKNNQNYGSNFRCYTNKEFKKACSCQNINMDALKYKNKLALFCIILAILIIIIILILLYMREHGGLGNLVPKLNLGKLGKLGNIKLPSMSKTQLAFPARPHPYNV